MDAPQNTKPTTPLRAFVASIDPKLRFRISAIGIGPVCPCKEEHSLHVIFEPLLDRKTGCVVHTWNDAVGHLPEHSPAVLESWLDDLEGSGLVCGIEVDRSNSVTVNVMTFRATDRWLGSMAASEMA